jgi:hypothetical protein
VRRGRDKAKEGRKGDALTRCSVIVSAKSSILPEARNAQFTGRREKRESETNRERPVAEHSFQRANGGSHAREEAVGNGRCTGK